MYILKLQHSFSAAHKLTHAYSKECNDNIHGHNFKVLIRIQTHELVNGMVVDFKKIKEIINQLDHKNLNDILKFEPTAENIAKFLYDEILKLFPEDIKNSNYHSINVTIWESDNASITYLI